MSNHLQIHYVGQTPFSTGTSLAGEERPMSYVMSFPLSLHHQGMVQESVQPSRSPSNFFKQSDPSEGPKPLLTSAQQSVGYSAAAQSKAFRRAAPLSDKDFPRDTFHPLISELQAEENAKAASFHPEVGYLANARRNGPTCATQKPPVGISTAGASYEANDGENFLGEDEDFSATRNRAKFYSKRGDLSTVSGRRFYTEGNANEPDHYASTIVEFANTQPTSFTAIAAKALANALHIEKPTSKPYLPPSYKMLSPEFKDSLATRNRSGRHQIEALLVGKHAMMQPPPTVADEGVAVNEVDVPFDPFSGRHVKAVNDKADSIDLKGRPPADKEEVLGGSSQMNLWSKFVDTYRYPTHVEEDARGLRVLASGHISFYSGITQAPSVSRFLTSKGVRQRDKVSQPTQLSKSSFLETGVVPCSQFTDLELIPPNAVGLDSDRLAIIFRNYGKNLKEIFLEGCPWVSITALSQIATYCPNLALLNLSRCPQVTDQLVTSIVSKCPKLQAVNLSGTYLSSEGLWSLLSHTSLEGLFLSGLEGLDSSCDPAWAELYRHDKLKYFDGSFSFHLSDAAIISLAQHCRSLEVLDISGCTSLTDSCLWAIGHSFRKLRILNLRLCTQFQAQSVPIVGISATKITDLDLTGMLGITTSVVEELMARCPIIQRLSLRGCNKIDDDTIQQLARRCKALEELDASGCIHVTLNGLMLFIHEQKTLRKLNISDSKFSGAEQRVLTNVREACEIVRLEHKPRALQRLNIYRQVEAPKKALVDPKAKKR